MSKKNTRKVILGIMSAVLILLPAMLSPFSGFPGDLTGFQGGGLDSSHYYAIEDFESYTAGDDINGKSGSLGDWIAYISGTGCYARVYDDGGNLVIDAKDASTSGGTGAKVFFDVDGSINAANIVSWRQRILNPEFNILLWEGAAASISDARVQVQFSGGNQVRYYAPDHGGLFSTGLTFGSGWETYEVMLNSTTQFMLRQFKSGAWSSWVGPFDLRNHWSSTVALCSAWDLDGSTPSVPHVYLDDVAVSWLDAPPPAITVNSPINGALLGDSNVPLNVNVVDNNLDSIWYRLDGGSSILMPTNTSIVVADGPHSIMFYANDTLGYVGSASRSFTVDTADPVVNITSPSTGATLPNSLVYVTFTATDNTKDETWYTVDGGVPVIVSGNSFPVTLTEGTHVIVVSCNDSLGRVSFDSVTITIDTPPVNYSAMEDFESYPVGDDIHGKSGSLGDWTTIASGGSYSRVTDESGNQVLDTVDTSTSGGVGSRVDFDVPGEINGINIVTWRQKIVSDEFNVVLWEGTLWDIASSRVQVQFSGENQVRYYAPDHGGLKNTGLTFGSGWETYEVMLNSTSQFMLRQFKNGSWSSWVGPFDLRNHWSSTGAVCSAWDLDGSTPSVPHVYFDDVGVRWYDATPPAITVNSPVAGAVLGSGNVSLNVELEDNDLDSIWYRLDGGSSILMPTNTSVTVADGSHSITFYANDTYGHMSSVARTFTVDTAAPVVSITSPSTGANLSSSLVYVAFVATDLTKDETWYTVDGGIQVVVTGNSFQVTLTDGSHVIVVYCNDSLGRNSSDSITFTIDSAQINYSAMEDFESYTVGDDMQGKSGPLGDWATITTGGSYSRVYNESVNQVMDTFDPSSSGGVNSRVIFDVPGVINGVNVVTWRQRIAIDNFNVILTNGTNWTDCTVQVQFSGGNQVRFYAPAHGGLINTGLTFGSSWETYEVMLYSNSQFLLRQFKDGSWSDWMGPFELRTHWLGTDVCAGWALSGSTPSVPHVYFDDVGVRWYDATSPAITVNSPVAGGVLGSDNVSLNVEVVDNDLDSIWYRLDGGSLILMPTNTSIIVADGPHSITFYANDTLGHLSSSESRSFTVDTAGPVVVITSPSDGANLSNGTVNVTFTATDLTKDDTWYTVDGGAPVIVSGSSFSLPLADGIHTIVVYCNDSFGGLDSGSITVTIDASDPVITVNSPTNGASLGSSNVSLNVQVSDSHLDVIWYVLDGGSATILSTNTSISVADGPHSITFYANDLFGHMSAVSRSFTVDTADPVVVITSPSDGANLSNGTVNVTFTATDLTKGDTWYTVDGGAPVIVSGSSFSLPLVDGIYTIVVHCNDSFGRVSNDSVMFTIDATNPSIAVFGFAGLSIMQGDVRYLNWTLADAHPSTYTIRLNGQVVRSGSYSSSGTNVSVLIDAMTLGWRNYTIIAQDTFGHEIHHDRQIWVGPRTDGGIFLSVGVNLINRGGTYAMFLTLNMSHWAVLYLNVDVTVTSTSSILPAPLPSGLVIALPVAFNLSITNSSALSSGSIRIYYSQASIANQVNENDMVPLRWDAGTSAWVVTTTGMSRTDNFIDIPLSENGLYIIASTPKQGYDPILIIVLIGLTGGIVAAAGYGYARKKSIKQKGTSIGKSKDKTSTAYSAIPSSSAEAPVDESLAKRARLMRMSTPSSASSNPAQAHVTSISADVTATLMPAKKKAGVTDEPVIDIAARAENAKEMASEVSVESIVPRCVVHKGPISGLSYTCKHCGVQYCANCAAHLAKSGEKCWNCGGAIEAEGLVTTSAQTTPILPMEGRVTMFEPEVFSKISELGIEEKIVDDLLELLKDIPANNRLQYLEDMFKEMPEDKEDSL